MINGKSGYVESGDAKIFYRQIGNGTPMLLLHGNGERQEIFRKQAECLKNEYQLILMDSRGHGRSQTGRQNFHIRLLAEDVHCLMKALKLDKIILFGFSDGANIALQMASMYPECVLAVIAVSGNVQPNGLTPWFLFLVKAQYYIYRGLEKLHLPVWKKRQLAGLMAMNPQMTRKDLSRISAPVLILTGQKDIVKSEHSKEMGRMIPNATVKIFRDSNHFSMFEKTEDYMKLIKGYLRKQGL